MKTDARKCTNNVTSTSSSLKLRNHFFNPVSHILKSIRFQLSSVHLILKEKDRRRWVATICEESPPMESDSTTHSSFAATLLPLQLCSLLLHCLHLLNFHLQGSSHLTRLVLQPVASIQEEIQFLPYCVCLQSIICKYYCIFCIFSAVYKPDFNEQLP